MPAFEPFRAFRYAAADLDPLIAPPYDVLSETEVAQLAAQSEYNIVHVDVPRGGTDRYARAATTLRGWIDASVLVEDPAPSYTIYRMRFVDAGGRARDVAGVLGGLEVVDEGTGGVLPHERTTPKASTDRLDLTRATAFNLSPVWGLSLARGLTELLAAPGELMGRVVEDDVEHVVERVDDPIRIAAIRAHLAGDDVVIADGHHRYGISRTYRDEIRSATGRMDTPAEQTLAFVGELIADQLSVEAIHRLYRGVPPELLRSTLARRFDLEPLDGESADVESAGVNPPSSRLTPQTLLAMESAGFLTLITAQGVEKLTPKPGAFDGVRALDGAWLEATLADSEAVRGGVEVDYQHGLSEVVAAVESGRAAAAVLIRPVTVAEIERTAREGLLMPPKSTFFVPKLKTGLVLRSLR